MESESSSVKRLSWHIPSFSTVLDALGESSGLSKLLGNLVSLVYNAVAAVVGDVVSVTTGVAYRDDELEYAGSSLDVPGYCQIESYTCGFMAGLIVLHTFHPKADSTDFFYTVDPCRFNGTEIEELVEALKIWDVGVTEHADLDFEDICAHIDDGYPVITYLAVWPGIGDVVDGIDHWVVIYGHDDGDLLIANNNQNRLTRREFKKQWADEGFGLVCWGEG